MVREAGLQDAIRTAGFERLAGDRRRLRGRDRARRAVLRDAVPRRARDHGRAAGRASRTPGARHRTRARPRRHARRDPRGRRRACPSSPRSRGRAATSSGRCAASHSSGRSTRRGSCRDVEQVGAWLAAHLPEPLPATVVHGDYRLGNMMVAPGEPTRILAVLDWEMGAIGDPRADVGYLLATYSEPDGRASALGSSPVTAEPGLPVARRARRALRRAERPRRRAARVVRGARALEGSRLLRGDLRPLSSAASWEPRTRAPRSSSTACRCSRETALASRRI